MIFIYTDGSCKPNPGPSGYGVVVIEDGVKTLYSGGYSKNGTNNIAELLGIRTAIELAEGKDAVIYSDSSYAINSIVKWGPGWKRNGWTRVNGDDIPNIDIIKDVFELYMSNKSQIDIRHVKAHNGDVNNELADMLANFSVDNKIEKITKVDINQLDIK